MEGSGSLDILTSKYNRTLQVKINNLDGTVKVEIFVCESYCHAFSFNMNSNFYKWHLLSIHPSVRPSVCLSIHPLIHHGILMDCIFYQFLSRFSSIITEALHHFIFENKIQTNRGSLGWLCQPPELHRSTRIPTLLIILRKGKSQYYPSGFISISKQTNLTDSPLLQGNYTPQMYR